MKNKKNYINPKFKLLRKELFKLRSYGYIQFMELSEKLDLPIEAIVELTPILDPRYRMKIDYSCIM